MKVLFYASYDYMNANYLFVLNELKAQSDGEIAFIDVNKHRIDELKSIIQHSQLIILDHSVIFSLNFYRESDLTAYMDSRQTKEFYYELVDIILNASKPLIYFQSYVDIHNTAVSEFDNFFESIDAIVWLYHTEPTRRSSLSEHLIDPWMHRDDCPYENWISIKSLVPSQFQMLHSLNAHEIDIGRSNRLKWDLSVCGERYATRKSVIDSISSSKTIRLAPYRRNDLLISIVSRGLLKTRVPAKLVNRTNIRIRRWHQWYVLHNSLASFTCGSAYRYPVRKFFEIPSSGSVLLAFPFSGMDDCGFQDGINYIKLHEPDECEREIRFLKSNAHIADKLVRSAKDMMHRHHTVNVRVKHLLKFIKDVSIGKTVVAEFRDGEFQFNYEY